MIVFIFQFVSYLRLSNAVNNSFRTEVTRSAIPTKNPTSKPSYSPSFTPTKKPATVTNILLSPTLPTTVPSTTTTTPTNYELMFSGTATGYSSYVLKSYHDDVISRDASLTDCFTTCTGSATCKMIFFYHCTNCKIFFCYGDSSPFSTSKVQGKSTHNTVLYDVYAYNKI